MLEGLHSCEAIPPAQIYRYYPLKYQAKVDPPAGSPTQQLPYLGT